MQKLLLLRTLFKLGLWNVTYMIWYLFSLKTGIRTIWFPKAELPTDQDFYKPTTRRNDYPEKWKHQLLQDADKIISGNLRYYAYHWKEIGNPPNWFLSPFNSNTYPNPHLHWTKLPDFHPSVGDIKNIWEASRFEWVVTLARAYAVTVDEKYLLTLNFWLKDWALKNPLNTGPNWKCGQEASIRIFNLLNAAYILQQYTNPAEALVKIIHAHLNRISPNISYAIVQDNNHGTSEAAGLFIGGSWLFQVYKNQGKNQANSKININAHKGRYWLENRVQKLITNDGSFSQHSVNYHRVMLDTLSFAEFWRVKLSLDSFSQSFYAKARSATNWLSNVVDKESGDAPITGANDGALLLNTNSCSYRDYRPSIQLASLLFFKSLYFKHGLHNESLYWMGLEFNNNVLTPYPYENRVLPTGYVIMKGNDNQSWALIRFPYFKFRPSHNDVFHFDLWYAGHNILCDVGSYSYNPPSEERDIDLKSVHHHNTVTFDSQEQMPKISRFLLGNWLKPEFTDSINTDIDGTISWKGSYFDNNKNRHQRTISVKNNTWTIKDTLIGNFKTATIGFNLNTTEARLEGNTCITPFATITFNANSQQPTANSQQPTATITNTIISKYYFQKRAIQRLNYTVSQSNTYITTIQLI